jgi:hypothetical protein
MTEPACGAHGATKTSCLAEHLRASGACGMRGTSPSAVTEAVQDFADGLRRVNGRQDVHATAATIAPENISLDLLMCMYACNYSASWYNY